MKIYRQGDVLITQIKSIPKNTEIVERENGRIILAHGELTGHAHAIKGPFAELCKTKLGQMFLTVTKTAGVVHEEHSTVKLPKGFYRVVRQTEYSPQALRNVAD